MLHYDLCKVLCNKLSTVLLFIIFGSQFTDDPSVAICSDSGGSVFVLTFK